MKLSDFFADQSPAAIERMSQGTEKKQFEDVLRRLVLSQQGNLNNLVTPTNCMQSPTVNSIVTAVSRRIKVTPVHVYQKTIRDGRAVKELLPNHSVEQRLQRPNQWQSYAEFWGDATSALMRWGNFYAFKSQGTAGPIRELLPLNPGGVEPEQDEQTWQVTYRVSSKLTGTQKYDKRRILHFREEASNFVKGDSRVEQVSWAIAMEILAEKFGVNFFRNGALPLLIFHFMEGSSGFQTTEQEDQFLADLKDAFGGNNMLSSMLLPKGMDKPEAVVTDFEKMQMVEARKYQREVIAGAFGVPQHLVGNLEDAHYNNIEQQDKDFTENVILPYARLMEAALERDLLTDEDRRRGVIIRFNLDAVLRATFRDRQEGLQIQRQNGIISANEWREHEGMNPRDDEFGDDYMHPANMTVDGEEDEATESDIPAGDQESDETSV